MTLRNRFLITAAVLCHLLLVPPLVTSQLPPANTGAAARAERAHRETGACPATPCALAAAAQKEKEDVHTICAIQQEEEGSVYKLHGAVEIYYGKLRAAGRRSHLQLRHKRGDRNRTLHARRRPQ